MSLRLRALELYLPAWVERWALRRLFEVTAAAFGRDPGSLRGLDRRTLRACYASFTDRCARDALAGGADLDLVSCRLWTGAHALGDALRRGLGVHSTDEALRALRLAYRVTGIDLRADRLGDVVVERCPFARRYSPSVCALMSSLDAGLVAGLTRGGRLTFSERITEGRPRCRARISWEVARA